MTEIAASSAATQGPYCLKRNGYRRADVASNEDVTEGPWLEVVVANQPPTVTITSPKDGHVLPPNSSFSFEVEATGDVAVEAVEFLIDSKPVSRDRDAPYVYPEASIGSSPLSISARATDLAGKVGSTEDVVAVPQQSHLVVSLEGDGRGRVTSSPEGIDSRDRWEREFSLGQASDEHRAPVPSHVTPREPVLFRSRLLEVE